MHVKIHHDMYGSLLGLISSQCANNVRAAGVAANMPFHCRGKVYLSGQVL